MKIIGITGTLSSGKGTVVEYLKKKGFKHFSVTKAIVKEIKKRGLSVNRDSMTIVANDLRKNNSPSFIVDKLYRKAKKYNKNSIIESIRVPGEVISLRKKSDFYLLAIDADIKIRYKRAILRNSKKDSITFDKFKNDEKRELSSNDPNKQNLAGCIKMADYKIINNGTLKELHQQINKALLEFI